MAILQKFPEAQLGLLPRRRARISRKALLLTLAVSGALWAALILLSVNYL